MISYKTTVNSILRKLQDQVAVVKEGDLLEVFKTVYRNNDKEKLYNLTINNELMTQPIATSRSGKAVMIKDGSLLSEIYQDMERGDILRVQKIEGNKIICENLSMKPEYKHQVILNKMDIIKQDFCVIERVSQMVKESLKKISPEISGL